MSRGDKYWVQGGGHTTGYPTRGQAKRVSRQVKGSSVSSRKHASGGNGCMVAAVALLVGSAALAGGAVWTVAELISRGA